MSIDRTAFLRVCNPSTTINCADPEQGKFYIDFSSVREGQGVEEMADYIASYSDEFTCQLFTGHIGCGKSTELLRLKSLLEKENFHAVYFGADHVLEIGDVNISDILLATARQVIGSLEPIGIEPPPKDKFELLKEGMIKVIKEVGIPIGAGLSINIFNLIGKWFEGAKIKPEIHNHLRGFSEPYTPTILEAINKELLEPAIQSLTQKGKKGLVVIVDNLDRVQNIVKVGKMQHEYLFFDRGEQLKLNCHIIYTVPFELRYQDARLRQRFPSGCSVLPMIPVMNRDNRENEAGMELMRQMALARAFPNNDAAYRNEHVTEVFDRRETLDRLCRISGGHVRDFLIFLNTCIRKQKSLPISSETLENVIRESRNNQTRAVSDDEWQVLKQVRKDKKIHKTDLFQDLMRRMFIFEYQDRDGFYADVNPLLAESREMMD